MAPWAYLLGEGAKVFKVNPLAFPETAGHPCQDRIHDSDRVHLGEEELFGYRPGELALVHGYAGAVSGAMRIRRPFALLLRAGGFVRGDPVQYILGDLPEVGGVVLDNRGRGLVPGEVGLL